MQDDDEFDLALVAAWFALAADSGRQLPSIAAAAQSAGLPLDRARARFASRSSVLMRFGRMADQAALTGMVTDGAVRDRLFDLIMRRIDALQAHRGGIKAVLRLLPTMPPLALLMATANERSMRWLLDASGVSTAGMAGELRVRGLVAVWLWTVRAWQTDDSLDLSTTMAALDRALGYAERAAGWLGAPASPSPELSPDPIPPDSVPPEHLPPISPLPEGPADGMPGLEPN